MAYIDHQTLGITVSALRPGKEDVQTDTDLNLNLLTKAQIEMLDSLLQEWVRSLEIPNVIVEITT